MVTPIISKNTAPTIIDNPNYKKCLWLDTSHTPAKIMGWNEEDKTWVAISDSGDNKNINGNDPIERYRIWVGTIDDFEALDILEDDVIYQVKGVGEFVGNVPLFESIQGVKFVDKSYTGKRNLGVSWKFPFNNLQDALDAAVDGDEIWVKIGTYTNTINSENSYNITKKVTIYGGFVGTENSLAERKLTVKTVLDGENKRRLINSAADGVVIDGISFENGFTSNKGGAIYSTRDITVRYCNFVNNNANYGGACANVTNIFNSVFIANGAIVNGTSIYYSKLGLVVGCTIVEGNGPNAIFCESGVSLRCYNTVTWTSVPGGDGIVADESSDIRNCASTLELPGENNILLSRENVSSDSPQSNPSFSNPEGYDFTITRESALVNKGDKSLNYTDLDFIGNSRISWDSTDIGAYEYQNHDIVRTVAGKTGDVTLETSDIIGLDDFIAKSEQDHVDHIKDFNNPHNVSKDQVGLDQVENIAPADLPISNATQEALDKLSKNHSADIDSVTKLINDHVENLDNPHKVTKDQIGLGNVENIAPSDLPVSDATKEELDKVNERVTEIIESEGKPNGIATLDDKGKLSLSQLPGEAIEILEGFRVSDTIFNDVDNIPYELQTNKLYIDVTEGQNRIYRWDRSKLVELSDNIKIGLDEGNAFPAEEGNKLREDLNLHKSDTNNPHKVTKEQIGLDKVDNTPDLLKPISEAQQIEFNKIRSELGLKADLVEGKVPIAQLPDAILGNVSYQGTWDVETNEPHLVNGDTTTNGHYYIAINSGIRFGYEFEPGDWVINNKGNWQKVDNVDSVKTVNGKKGIVIITLADIPGLQDELNTKVSKDEHNLHLENLANPHQVTKEQVGLGNVENLAPRDLPVSDATKNLVNSVTTELTNSISENNGLISKHIEDNENPHGVTKDQIGLGQVENIAPRDLPVSDATKSLIDSTKDELSKSISDNSTLVNNHISNIENPHNVTKEQIGLGNVENISPADLPISNATKSALDNKANLVNGKISEEELPARAIKSLHYSGIWDADTNSPKLENESPDLEGNYYVVRAPGEIFGNKFYKNDLIANANGTWIKICGGGHCLALEDRIAALEKRVLALENNSGGGGGGDTPDVPDTPDLTNVSITSFTMTADEFNELGSTVNSTFNWSYSTDNIASQSINGESLDKSLRSKLIENIKTDTEFILKVTSLNTVEEKLSIKFVPRLYLGSVTSENQLTESEIKDLGSDNLLYAEPYLGKKTFNCLGGKYVNYIVPTSEAANVVVKDGNGFLFNAYTTYTVDVTNEYGITTNYTVFKMNNKYYSEEIVFDFSIKTN